MRHRIAALAAAVVLLSPASSTAQKPGPIPSQCSELQIPHGVPFFWAVMNLSCQDLSHFITPGIPGKTWTLSVPDLVIAGVRLSANGTFNADPFITFGATTTNLNSATTTYAFLFGTPIVPGMYNHATSNGGLSLTSGEADNATVSPSGIYPTYVSGYGTLGLTPTNLGVDLGTAPCIAAGGGAGVTTTTTTCNYGAATSDFAPALYDNLEALLTYDQTDLRSVASWSGSVALSTVSTVPEPTSLTLFASGLMVLIGAAARRRARARDHKA
jgi:hypothetical protein